MSRAGSADVRWADLVESSAKEASPIRISLEDALFEVTTASESIVGLVKDEILRRRRYLGELYPFDMDPNAVTISHVRPNPQYEDFLAASLGAESGMAEWFEVEAPAMAAKIFGALGRFVSFGTAGGSAGFVARLEQLQDEFGVPRSYPEAHEGAKDAGLDAVVWLDLGFGLSSTSVVILAQITVAADLATLIAKCGDIDQRRWARWLSLSLDPVTALCTPRILTDHSRRRLQTRALVLDRASLLRLSQIST